MVGEGDDKLPCKCQSVVGAGLLVVALGNSLRLGLRATVLVPGLSDDNLGVDDDEANRLMPGQPHGEELAEGILRCVSFRELVDAFAFDDVHVVWRPRDSEKPQPRFYPRLIVLGEDREHGGRPVVVAEECLAFSDGKCELQEKPGLADLWAPNDEPSARFSVVTPLADCMKLPGMDDAGRPASLIAWIECESWGRIDKAAHDFNYPADMASDMALFVWLPCEQCGRLAKLHLQRELKPAH